MLYCFHLFDGGAEFMAGADTVEITGGTGRFEGTTGSLFFTVSASDYALGPENTVSVIYTYTAEGTITY
jgi:hypothetical protein